MAALREYHGFDSLTFSVWASIYMRFVDPPERPPAGWRPRRFVVCRCFMRDAHRRTIPQATPAN